LNDPQPVAAQLEALRRWRAFAGDTSVTWAGRRRSWAAHIAGAGFVDEERLVQPVVFPEFARLLLGYEPGADLAAEETNSEGTPDFTPADSITHPFVFETKGTSNGVDLAGHDAQVARYLLQGRPRIRKVVLTNVVGVRVFELDDHDIVRERYRVNLRSLLGGPEQVVARTAEAVRLATFVDEFRHRTLSVNQRLQQVRNTREWNPLSEVTSSEWVLRRLDRVVRTLTMDVESQVSAGALTDLHITSAGERKALLEELRLIAARLGVDDSNAVPLEAFLEATPATLLGKARRQYCSHVAYYGATRLTLVRVWEDLGLLESMLHDGGFDHQMHRFDDVVADVVDFSFARARTRYRSLFDQRNGYSWYAPSHTAYVDTIYELANTYLGNVRSDVLGQVYERMLERIDRKLLGQYYTPRDIIGLIWDLVDLNKVAEETENVGREPRILDIATGSGGFLVEAAGRLRERLDIAQTSGAEIATQTWLDDVAEGLNGIEIQRFSAYLAELNLLVQLGQVASKDSSLKIPSLGILSADTLSFHEPDQVSPDWQHLPLPNDLVTDSEERRERALRLKAAESSNFRMDVSVGNPPYIGEKLAAPLLARTRAHYPYWNNFVGQHMDYLYWFLILGVSKLRQNGRFGFITTEYWLRSAGAAPLRKYLASRCHVERIVLFRDFRLFPDAKGQHSMIVVGTRMVPSDLVCGVEEFTPGRPRVSIYEGGTVAPVNRSAVLSAMRDAPRYKRAGVRSFTSAVSPNTLRAATWADVILTADELARRRKLTEAPQLPLLVTKGVETTVNGVTSGSEGLLSQQDLTAVGGPGSRAGIQLLRRSEVERIGLMNDAERAVIRRVVNTKDVYPYAVVVPLDAAGVVYLPKPAAINEHWSDEQVVTGVPFPVGLPHLEAHMRPFRSLLEHKTRARAERRPWWTLHRPREDVLGDASADGSGWARYCLTARWGGGGHLVVGLAPPGTSPASGLHVLRPGKDDIPAAYLTALYNSTMYQEIAEALPPGQLRKEDLARLGLPDLAHRSADAISGALSLAAIVTELVTVHGPRWPLLQEILRANVALPELPLDYWTPAPGPAASWGPVAGLPWVQRLDLHRSKATRLGEVVVDHDLYGLRVTAAVRGQGGPAVTLHLPEPELAAANALATAVGGLAAKGGTVQDVVSMRLPISPALMVSLAAEHVRSLRQLAGKYNSNRSDIDDALDQVLR